MEYLSQVIARTVSLVPERAFIVTESETLTYTAIRLPHGETRQRCCADAASRKGDRVEGSICRRPR